MYQFKIGDSITQQVQNLADSTSNSSKSLIEKLKEFNKKYNTNSVSLNNNIDLKKLEDVVIDADKIKEDASNSLIEEKNSALNSIDENYSNKETQLKKDIEDLNLNALDYKNNINNTYETAKQTASDDALKRGLARSSIVINKLDAFNNEQISKINSIDEELTNSINELNFELNTLSAQKENAINEFDISYTVKLNDKINELTNELTQKQLEVTKYNNEIAQIEENYNLKYKQLENDMNNDNWDKEQDMLQFTSKYGTNLLSKYKQTQVENMVKDAFSGLTKEEIVNMLDTDSDLKNALGSYYDYIKSLYI